jgi:RecA-family ATPase
MAGVTDTNGKACITFIHHSMISMILSFVNPSAQMKYFLFERMKGRKSMKREEIYTQEFWDQYTKEDWEDPQGSAVAAFVLNRNKQGYTKLARASCEATGADFNQFARHAAAAIQDACRRDKENNHQTVSSENESAQQDSFICLAHVQPKEMNWLWKPYIPSGNMTIMQGDPGSGKTHLAAWLAAMVTSGSAAPDGQQIEAGSVIFQSMEDGLEEGLVPRLISAGADMSKVFCFDESKVPLYVQDLKRFEAVFSKFDDLRLFIIDPIQSYLGSKTDMNRANEIRAALKGLLNLCNRYDVALVMIGHMGKAPNKNLYRLLGSMDFIAQARSVLTVGEKITGGDERIVLPTKTSNAKAGDPFSFKITDEGVNFISFQPGVTEYSLRHIATDDDSKTEEACRFLITMLHDAPMTVKEMDQAGKEIDLKPRTLRRAREQLKENKVLSVKKVGSNGSWYWFETGRQVFELAYQLAYIDDIDPSE